VLFFRCCGETTRKILINKATIAKTRISSIGKDVRIGPRRRLLFTLLACILFIVYPSVRLWAVGDVVSHVGFENGT
jgi:hypothetical protein